MQEAIRRDHIVEAIKETARQMVPPKSEVVLFGSRARGDARKDSDWDVLILLDKERITLDDIDQYTYPLREMGWDYGACINTILYTKTDWQRDAASPFVENVNREGVRLWG